MNKLSVVLATYNEEKNIGDCLESVRDIADEIIVVDGSSADKTADIAKRMGAKVVVTDNPEIFHINKQKALDLAVYEWILQLDADERVTDNLAAEIKRVINMTKHEVLEHQKSLRDQKLFLRHQKLIEKRDGKIGSETDEINAFFVPRLNFFLGRYLRYGGVYPDGVIRLMKRGKARFPCKDVHEQIEVIGKVGWLENPLRHIDSPTFIRYIRRNNKYVSLLAQSFREKSLEKNFYSGLKYLFFMPAWWFLLTFIRHKGYKDSWQGFVFSFFSAIRFPRAYIIYLKNSKSS